MVSTSITGALRISDTNGLISKPELLKDIEADNPTGDIFIPKGACWLDLQEGWCRLFRGDALAGQRFASADEIERAMQIATIQLNHRARL